MHAIQQTSEGERIVRADGTEPRAFDTDRPVLHLLPQFLLQSSPRGLPPVELTIEFPDRPDLPLPHDIVVRQPMPNRRYLIGGTGESRYGFLIPLPADLPRTLSVRFTWRFPFPDAAKVAGAEVVEHNIHLTLQPGGHGKVFTTDNQAWPRGPKQGHMICAGAQSKPPAGADYSETPLPPGIAGYRINQAATLEGVLLSDIIGFVEWEQEQLHEIERTAALDPESEKSRAHRAGSCVEMPSSLLFEAIQLAHRIPFGKNTEWEERRFGSETHPALRLISDWWNTHAPDPRTRRAGRWMPWVRVDDEGSYHCGYPETPEVPVDCFSDDPTSAARIGDLIRVEFFQGQDSSTWNASGFQHWTVSGEPDYAVGISPRDIEIGRYDEARYTLDALVRFPTRFPEAWAMISGRPWLKTPGYTPFDWRAENTSTLKILREQATRVLGIDPERYIDAIAAARGIPRAFMSLAWLDEDICGGSVRFAVPALLTATILSLSDRLGIPAEQISIAEAFAEREWLDTAMRLRSEGMQEIFEHYTGAEIRRRATTAGYPFIPADNFIMATPEDWLAALTQPPRPVNSDDNRLALDFIADLGADLGHEPAAFVGEVCSTWQISAGDISLLWVNDRLRGALMGDAGLESTVREIAMQKRVAPFRVPLSEAAKIISDHGIHLRLEQAIEGASRTIRHAGKMAALRIQRAAGIMNEEQ